jgi:hypothetical protein
VSTDACRMVWELSHSHTSRPPKIFGFISCATSPRIYLYTCIPRLRAGAFLQRRSAILGPSLRTSSSRHHPTAIQHSQQSGQAHVFARSISGCPSHMTHVRFYTIALKMCASWTPLPAEVTRQSPRFPSLPSFPRWDPACEIVKRKEVPCEGYPS